MGFDVYHKGAWKDEEETRTSLFKSVRIATTTDADKTVRVEGVKVGK